MKAADSFAQVTNGEYAWYRMSCTKCFQHQLDPRDKGRIVTLKGPRELNADCSFCEILRQCQQHFAKDCKSIIGCFKGYSSKQICLLGELNRCKDIHVQLYSKGPFFISIEESG